MYQNLTTSADRNHLRRLCMPALLAGLLLDLGGCANKPSPGSYLEWIAPPGQAGQFCVEDCGAARWRCDTRVADRLEICAANAQIELDACEIQEITRLESCYDNLIVLYGEAWETHATQCDIGTQQCSVPACSVSTDCEYQYRNCYLDCGGDIVQRGAALTN